MKTIGLIGGISWVSTIEYYRAINEMVHERVGGGQFARCIIYSFDFYEVQMLNQSGDKDDAKLMFLNAVQKLQVAGADCVLLCANTAHRYAGYISSNIKIPLIHIAEATLKDVQAKGIKKLALLGTKFTMEEDFVKKTFTDQGIEVLIPTDAERQYVHHTIHTEMGAGRFLPETKKEYQKIIAGLAELGAEGVILGCTEIPILIKQEDVDITVFDTTNLHAQAAVDFALS